MGEGEEGGRSGRMRGRGRALGGGGRLPDVSSYWDSNPSQSGPTIITSFDLNHFLIGCISKYTWGVRAPTYALGGHS